MQDAGGPYRYKSHLMFKNTLRWQCHKKGLSYSFKIQQPFNWADLYYYYSVSACL